MDDITQAADVGSLRFGVSWGGRTGLSLLVFPEGNTSFSPVYWVIGGIFEFRGGDGVGDGELAHLTEPLVLHVPTHMTETEVLEVIEHVVHVLVPHFSIPSMDFDDLAQEARIMALECLPRYDPSPGPDGTPTRPLENFVYSHVKRRMLNLRRNLVRRADAPCLLCHRGDLCNDGQFCSVYLKWKRRNDAKADLLRPSSLEHIADMHETRTRTASTVEDNVEMAETLARIDDSLPVNLRATYLMLRAGKAVPRARRTAVERVVREILGEEMTA